MTGPTKSPELHQFYKSYYYSETNHGELVDRPITGMTIRIVLTLIRGVQFYPQDTIPHMLPCAKVLPRYCKGRNRDKTLHITLPNRTYPPQVSPPPCAKSGNPLSCLGKSGYSRDQNPGPNYTIASTLAMECQLG